ncbi:MAG TPA: FAD-binding oxidoreductase [Gammaproteobacteria bacterium]|nr:FAD-binding oxidoreductase [Gammaproteobacteria bacterium]
MDIAAALAQIRTIVGERGVVAPDAARTLLRDHRGLYAGAAALVVQPGSTQECAAILAVCNSAGLGVVPQGGNTGYCGGATPFDAERQILLSLARMNRVRRIDPIGFTMTVEAGAVLADAQAAAHAQGLLLPLSMGSEGSCRIGGNLSTNAGGLNVVRYGTARELVLGLEVALPSGEVLTELKGLRKDNTGYDLKSLFLGAEGTLGVITAAVLRLYPAPRSRQTAWAAVASQAAACALLAAARRSTGDQVVAAEYLSRTSLELVLAHIPGVRDPLAEAHEHYVLLELAGSTDDAALRGALERLLEAGLADGAILDGTLAESNAQREALWKLRETIPEAERHEGQCVKHDISVPLGGLPDFLVAARERLTRIVAHRLSVFGHLGDGNLHYNLMPQRGQSFDAALAKELTATLYDYVESIGGSFSAEHGIGVFRRDDLNRYKSPVALELMRRIKVALDPNGIMNPGKVVG